MNKPNTPTPSTAKAAGEYLTLTEISSMLNIHKRTLRRLQAKNEFPLPHIVIGGFIHRWHRDAIQNWIAEQNRSTTPTTKTQGESNAFE